MVREAACFEPAVRSGIRSATRTPVEVAAVRQLKIVPDFVAVSNRPQPRTRVNAAATFHVMI